MSSSGAPGAVPPRDAATVAAPGAGSADARIDQKQLQWLALRAAARATAAREHLAPLAPEEHPDLWAGTVRDGVARGFAVRLEEAIALAGETDAASTPASFAALDDDTCALTTGKQLRRRKDVLIASGGARARFTRKGGLLFVDREHEAHSENCLWFEARRDHGDLDGFVAAPDERARLFSAQFLQPVALREAKHATELVLEGRLGRGPIGWPCRLTLRGAAEERSLRVSIALGIGPIGWRLRTRVLGVAPELVQHRCTPVRELVRNDRGGFVADTLVRSCAALRVDDELVEVPDAACQRPLTHDFRFGVASEIR
ncbi:MAG: hypothetical protein H6835_09875 [Planctomycetes bacterium]|nr:hypothetical protein [Planctomycetota bacterium]